MKINDSQNSKSQTNSKGMRSQQSWNELPNNQIEEDERSTTTIPLNNRQRLTQIVVSMIVVVLSTLWVQITMQRNAPFVRAAQCYFNEIVLQHNSQDIYEGKDVIYWKTGEYYNFKEVLEVYRRLNQTVNDLNVNSLFHIVEGQNQAQFDVQLLVKYGIPRQNKITDMKQYHSSLSGLSTLLQETLMRRQFYQNLWQVEIYISVPIIYRQSDRFVNIKLQSQIYSSMMMSFYLNVDIVDRNDDLVKQQYDKGNLGVRRLPGSYNMELQIPYIFWVIVAFYLLLFVLEFRYLVKRNREVNRLLRLKIRQEVRIQKLMEEVNKSQGNLQQVKINHDSSNESKQQQNIDFADENFVIPQKYQLSLLKRVRRVGIYYVAQFCLSFISLITCYNNHNGIICFLAWMKLVVYLTQTKNKYMVGFLFEETIPIYLKILLNIVLLITAFVLFNILVYPTTVKFQTLKLGYFQYVFNYFQYGIYQNFILAFSQYGLFAQFFYFLQLIYLLYIGNNILQSVLANQVMKNSYMETVKEMIEELKTQCPACGADPKEQVKESSQFLQVGEKKSKFFSKIMKSEKIHSRIQSQISRDSYKILVESPLLAPFFPSKVQRKQSQKFMSPKLQNGKFQKILKQMNKKVEQQSITSKSKIEEISQLNTKYEGLKTLKLQISQSKIQENKQDKYLKKIKSKLQVLLKAVDKFNSKKKSSPMRSSQLISNHIFKEEKVLIFQRLLQKIQQFKYKVSQQMK